LLSRFPDVFLVEKSQEDLEAVAADLCAVTDLALADFDKMRVREGAKLEEDLRSRGKTIEALTNTVEQRSAGIVSDYRARLAAKMTEVLGNTQLDESRILTEAAIYADKVAVDEETVRLKSHLSQLNHMLDGGGAVGRKLDFLIQEFNREANTIGSKCNDIDTTRLVVEMKAEIEKIREQVQNIE
ncbi:MAG: YicC/YloC family endoribonuclease, partial [Pseudoflavonifractor sp.]